MKQLRSITSIGTTAIALSALLSQQSANAALLAYEGFDYTAGATLLNQNGGSGWSQSWQTNSTHANNALVVAGSYTYTDSFGNALVTSGNRTHITGAGTATSLGGGAGDNTGGNAANGQPFRGFNFARGHDATNGAYSTWISVMALRTGNPDPTPSPTPYSRGTSIGFFYNAASSTTGGNERFGIGRGTQSTETAPVSSALPDDTWGVIQQGNANATKASLVPWANSPADFILMRIDHIGTTINDLANADTIRMWINPASLAVAPSDALADVVINANEFVGLTGLGTIDRDFVFNRLRPFGGSDSAAVGYGAIDFDELRVGDGFVDVTPYTSVPEPTMAALGGLGILAMILRRRRC